MIFKKALRQGAKVSKQGLRFQDTKDIFLLAGAESEPVVLIPIIIGSVIVRVQSAIIVVVIRGEEARIARGNCTRNHLCHCSLNTLGAVSDLVS